MPLHPAVHIRYHSDKLRRIPDTRKQSFPISPSIGESVKVHAVVYDPDLFWRQAVSFHEYITHRGGIHYYVGRKAEQHARGLVSPLASQRPVPLFFWICQIAPTGNNDGRAGQPSRWHPQQICPRVVRMNHLKPPAVQKNGQTQQLVNSSYRKKCPLFPKLDHRNAGALQDFDQGTFRSEERRV